MQQLEHLAPTAATPPQSLARSSQRWRNGIGWLRQGWFFPGLLGLMLGVGLILPLLWPRDPNQVQITQRLQAPGATHWLGTDHLGRDVLARVIHGGQTALSFGLVAVALTMLLAFTIGVSAGYFGGRIDLALNGLIDLVLTLPTLLITLALLGVLGGSGANLIIALAAASWAAPARILRGGHAGGAQQRLRRGGARDWRAAGPNSLAARQAQREYPVLDAGEPRIG